MAEHAVFWTASLFAFFLLFRKSNLIPDTAEGFDSKKPLKFKDCCVLHDRIIVGIRWAKNAQFSHELLTFALPLLPGSQLCPVKVFLDMKRLVRSKKMIMF